VIDLYGLLPEELAERLGGSGRAKEVWAHIRAGRDPSTLGLLTDKARARLCNQCATERPTVTRRLTTSGGTTKLLLTMADGLGVETVIIPGRGRTTCCLSTQIGCARGCIFCATATMGLVRSLDAGEITAQLAIALSLSPAQNVVLMGMGEPLDNFAAVQRAIELLIHPHGFALGPRHVTLSTVGTSPSAIAKLRDVPVSLAWSVQAADDDVRQQLVPSTKYSMTELREAFLQLTNERRQLFVEVALIDNINDQPHHATTLADFLAPFGDRVRVNLLPQNPARAGLQPSSNVVAFGDILRGRGYFCMARSPRGLEVGAACGQLATQ